MPASRICQMVRPYVWGPAAVIDTDAAMRSLRQAGHHAAATALCQAANAAWRSSVPNLRDEPRTTRWPTAGG